MLQVGTAVKSGTKEKPKTRTIAQIGNALPLLAFVDWHAAAVKFGNDDYGVVLFSPSVKECVHWVPNREQARDAIEDLTHMPLLEHGVLPHVIWVRGTGKQGRFLAKLFYRPEDDSGPWYRPDELWCLDVQKA